MTPGPERPTPSIALGGDPANATNRLGMTPVTVSDQFVERLRSACADVSTDAADRAESSRDWWPLGMIWALDNAVGGIAGAICRPTAVDEVAAIASICNEERIPLTAAGGRSGVLGNAVPVHGGVVLDMCGITGIKSVDSTSMIADVRAGMFGDHFEDELRREHGATAGHWPQSMTLATVGGWIACRGAGQFSGRYGKIEDIVEGLDLVLADGRRITTGGVPRQAVGPDLTQLFVGSEGTLGIITSARLRLHPAPSAQRCTAWSFASIDAALDAMRRIVQRGATPAVLRLYDPVESHRSHQTPPGDCVLLALDEGDPPIIDVMINLVEDEARRSDAHRLDDSLVTHWLEHRNDVAALEQLISGGLVVDTMEVTGRWADLAGIYRATTDAIRSIDGTLSASAHQSHSYTSGGCMYFTFAGKVEPDARTDYYRSVWDAGATAALRAGASLSHHHGIGINRGRFVAEALGGAFDVLVATKTALDPNGILNPGKLGLASPYGDVPQW